MCVILQNKITTQLCKNIKKNQQEDNEYCYICIYMIHIFPKVSFIVSFFFAYYNMIIYDINIETL